MKNIVLFFCLITIPCWQGVFGQSAVGLAGSAQDKSPLTVMVEVTAARYLDAVAGQATLFYGRLQEPYGFSATNHPYLKDPRYTKGALRYGGTLYPDVPLRWDMFRDELIAFSPDNYSVVLSPDKAEEATIHGYHIIYLQPDSLNNSPPPGYYLLLYTGQYTVLSKPVAVTQHKSIQQFIENYFVINTKYYIKKEGTYFPIKSKDALLNALGDYHKELNHFIRVNKYNFRRDAETMIVETVKEFEKHLP